MRFSFHVRLNVLCGLGRYYVSGISGDYLPCGQDDDDTPVLPCSGWNTLFDHDDGIKNMINPETLSNAKYQCTYVRTQVRYKRRDKIKR